FAASCACIPGPRRQPGNARGIPLCRLFEFVTQTVSFRILVLLFAFFPKPHLDPVAIPTRRDSDTLVVTHHEIPKQFVESFVIKSILGCRYAKRNVIDARERPRVSHPLRKK